MNRSGEDTGHDDKTSPQAISASGHRRDRPATSESSSPTKPRNGPRWSVRPRSRWIKPTRRASPQVPLDERGSVNDAMGHDLPPDQGRGMSALHQFAGGNGHHHRPRWATSDHGAAVCPCYVAWL